MFAINISFFWKKSSMHFTKPKSSSLLDGQLEKKNYLQINAFPTNSSKVREEVLNSINGSY